MSNPVKLDERSGMGRQVMQFGVERRAVSGEGGQRAVMISTENAVRAGGGIARAAGAVLDPYKANPVVMWSHDYQCPPIGKCTGLSVEPGAGIVAEFEFPAEGVYPLADVVRGLWDGGFINAASIGFMPLEWKYEKTDGEEYPVFSKWELLEFSLVSIPRDREALRRAMEILRFPQDDKPEGMLGEAAPVDLGLLLRGLKAWREVLHG